MQMFRYKAIFQKGGDDLNRIKEVRESLNVSQIELARRANISQPFMCDLENNRRGAKPETYQRIADALDVPVAELMQKAG